MDLETGIKSIEGLSSAQLRQRASLLEMAMPAIVLLAEADQTGQAARLSEVCNGQLLEIRKIIGWPLDEDYFKALEDLL